MNALFELYRANLTEFLSNRRALFLTVAFPVLFIVIFGLVFTNQDKQDAQVGLAVEDAGPVGAQVAAALEALPTAGGADPRPAAGLAPAAPAFGPGASPVPGPSRDERDQNPLSALVFRRGAAAALLDETRAGRLDAVVVIPAETTARLGRGEPVEVRLHIDPSRQTLSPFLRGVIGGVLQEINARLTGRPPPLGFRTVPIRARDLRTIDYLLPGILAMSIMQLGLFATAQPLIALRVGGVLKRLGATPLRRSTLLVAYVALRLTVALLQTALIVAIGTLAFRVAVVGSWWQLAGWLFLGTLAFLATGFFMASVARNEESAIAAANVVNLPMLLLSGVFFPVNNLPKFLGWLVDLIPLNYLADALRQVMVDAPPQHSLPVNLAALLAWTGAMTLLAVWLFRWEENR